MRRLPFKSIRILHYNFEIVALDANYVKGTDRFGECDKEHVKINYDPDQAEPHIRDTILHEVLHGICMAYDIDCLDEEKTVTLISSGLIQVMQDNPKFWKWLQE